MQMSSPNIDRLSAALRALREDQEQGGQAADKLTLRVKCLKLVLSQLAEEGIAREDLKPLIEIEDELNTRLAQRPPAESNRRKGGAPSDILLARVAVVIDLLIKAGYEDSAAAQTLMRRLLAAGVAPPRSGGDARGWKRLLEWRADFAYGLASDAAKTEYAEFTRLLETIPAAERVKCVLDQQLWDRRRKPRV